MKMETMYNMDKTKVVIRKAKADDFEQVHELLMAVHNLHVKERGDIYKEDSPISMDAFKEELSNINNMYLVAEKHEKIVGICFAEIKNIADSKIMKKRKILNIKEISVKENEQRQGIGKKLYEEISKWGQEQKIDSIELLVWKFNKKVIQFYESLNMEVKNIRFEQKLHK